MIRFVLLAVGAFAVELVLALVFPWLWWFYAAAVAIVAGAALRLWWWMHTWR